MTNTDFGNSASVFRGTTHDATYQQQAVARYSGNPVIEALPQILPPQDAAQLLAYYPEIAPGEREQPPEIRMHLIMDALHFFEPLPVHIDLEQRISRVIRDGYVSRNPVAADHWQQLDGRVESIRKAGGIPLRTSNVNGFSIIGIPGIGKTTGVERVLQLYPQVIRHQTYRGQPFSRIQLVWLKLTCPHDGSIKGLCLDFFREVDSLVGTDYHRTYASGGRRTVDELIPAIARVAWIHCLGALVIDEIQHLNQAASGGAERMLNFFLQLMNTLGLPVLLIGTYAALQVLSRELRQIRRSCGQGDLIWDRMANDDVWWLFSESLWRYQHTIHKVPLTKELVGVLHEESAGIVDFAVKIFLLAQVRAIATGAEAITPAIIKSVAHDSLRLAQPALRALRTGDRGAVAMMTDIHPIDFSSAMHKIRKSTILKSISKDTVFVSDLTASAGEQTTGGPPAQKARDVAPNEDVSVVPAEPKSASKRRSVRTAKKPSECLLVQLADSGNAKGISAHNALCEAGIIRAEVEFQGTHAT